MRPSIIPDAEVLPDCRRVTIGAPRGREDTIHPIEACAERAADGLPIFRVRIELEDDDLEHFQAGEPVWLSMWGHVVPFSLSFVEGA